MVPSANSRSSVSSACSSALLEDLQAAIAGDPVVDVDDQVALVQVEEAVDRAALVAPAGDRAADLGAGEQLVVADDQRAGVDHVEARADAADGQLQPAGPGQLGVGEDLAQPLDLGRVVAGDQHAVAGRGAVELGLDLGQVAGEPLDALDPQVAGRLERVGGERRDGDRREAGSAARSSLRRVKRPRGSSTRPRYWRPSSRRSLGSSRATQVPSGKKSAAMAEAGGVGVVEPERGGERDRVPPVERALGFGVERADRLDLVAEELDPDRVGGVGGEHVEDAAADAELAGDLDDLGPRHAAVDEPGGQFLDRRPCRRRPTTARHRASASGLGTGWSIAWKGATINRGGSGPPQALEDAQPLAEDLVGRRSARAAASPRRGRPPGVMPANVATSSRKSSTSPTWASTMTSVVGACRPRAAAAERPRPSPRRRRSWRCGRS